MKKNFLTGCLFFVCLAVIIFLIFIGFFLYKNYKVNQNNKIILDIYSHYNQHVVTNKNTKLFKYDGKIYLECGEISQDVFLELDTFDYVHSKQKYFKIKDSIFYIYYQDVDITEASSSYYISDNYLVFNNNIIINGETNLISGEKYIKISEMLNLPIQYMDDNNYYVIYFNDLYRISKDSPVEVVSSNNSFDNAAEYVSVIDYSNVGVDKLKEQLEYLKSNQYYTINIDEYKEWLKSNIRLKEKAIILTYDEENNDILSVINQYGFNIILNKNLGINFVNNNETTNKDSKLDSLNRYKVTNLTSLDNFIKMCSGQKVVEYVASNNSSSTWKLPDINALATQIPVLNYHFFYDPSIGENCNESLCLDVKKFREQLDFLKNNGYKTLKMEEFRAWMYGEIDLPARSVLITIDDGAMGTGFHNGNKLIPILEEYDMYATLFLITGWWDSRNYISDHLDVESHTYNMHTGNMCSNQTRGAQLLCSTRAEVLADLKKSVEILNSNIAFCFPFYAYNDSAIQSVKEVGFKLAFIGGNRKATRSNDKYKIPRYPIYGSTSMSQFINMFK